MTNSIGKRFPDIPRMALTGFVVVLAIFSAVGTFTFCYAKGYSYLSSDSGPCLNCHVMRDHYRAWEVSSHRFAGCNECHLPQTSLLAKYYVKGVNGFNHSFAFTFKDVQVIRQTPFNQAVVEQNCIRCHAMTVSTIPLDKMGNRCTECHRDAGHAYRSK